VPQLDKIGTSIDATTSKLEATVQLSSQQISDLTRVVKTFETYRRNV
jgi:hypothetical protein